MQQSATTAKKFPVGNSIFLARQDFRIPEVGEKLSPWKDNRVSRANQRDEFADTVKARRESVDPRGWDVVRPASSSSDDPVKASRGMVYGAAIGLVLWIIILAVVARVVL